MHGENVLGCSPLPRSAPDLNPGLSQGHPLMKVENVLGWSPQSRSAPDSNPGLSQGNPLKVGWIGILITVSMFMMNPGILTGYQNIGLISQFSASHG